MRQILWASLATAAALGAGPGALAQNTALPRVEAPNPPVSQGRAGDWANLARYREANGVVIRQAAARRVVFMGDSITEGWAAQPFIGANARFVGRGISGQTAQQMLVRFRSDVIDLQPAVVHLMAGTNDIAGNTGFETPEEIVGYIVSMAELARANRIRVVLAAIPPAKRFSWRPGMEPLAQIRALNARLKAYAARQGIPFVDYGQVLAATDGGLRPELGPDGVHPNAAGYAAMAPLAEAAIARALR